MCGSFLLLPEGHSRNKLLVTQRSLACILSHADEPQRPAAAITTARRAYQMSNAPFAQLALSLTSISAPSVICCCSNAKCLSQSALICSSRAHAQSPFEGLKCAVALIATA